MPAFSQVTTRSLHKAGVFTYKHRMYVYGFAQEASQLDFHCFSYDSLLHAKDSLSLPLGKYGPGQFLDISHDTLHDVLNFYFQLANQQNQVTLCRADSNLKLLATTRNYDANHVNSMTAFDQNNYRHQRSMYIVKAQEDSSGRQYYLSKYELKNLDQPFEYEFRWQYPLERKYIRQVSVIAADSACVLLYVHVSDGPKKGQWILRVDARRGTLYKGTKLNPKGSDRHYLYSASVYNAADRSLDVAGSILPAAMIDFSAGTANFKDLPKVHQLFMMHIDSLGQVGQRFEKSLPLPAPATPGATGTGLHLKIGELQRLQRDFILRADLYSQKSEKEFSYYSSSLIRLRADEDSYSVQTSTVYPLPKLIPNLVDNKPGNDYGRVTLNSVTYYDHFQSSKAAKPVLMQMKNDSAGNPVMVLRQVNVAAAKTRYLSVKTGKKGAEVGTILDSDPSKPGQLLTMGNNYFLVSFDPEKNIVVLTRKRL